MDDEDSQDELINRNASHGKGKRPASSILSDGELLSTVLTLRSGLS